MAVDDAHYVGPRSVDGQVQQHFAGVLLRSGQLLAVIVYFSDVFRLQIALGHHRGRAKHFAVVETDGDVAVVGGREALGIQTTADFAHLFFEFMFVHWSIPIRLAATRQRSALVRYAIPHALRWRVAANRALRSDPKYMRN